MTHSSPATAWILLAWLGYGIATAQAQSVDTSSRLVSLSGKWKYRPIQTEAQELS